MKQNDVNTKLLKDEAKLKLADSDLFDRIINLKLYAGERKPDGTSIVKDEYVIRSDWEVHYPEQNKVMTQ